MPLRGRVEAIRDEAGFALVLALTVIVALGAAIGSVAFYVTSNFHSATHDTSNQDALALAEAGLNMAYSTLEHSSNPTSAAAVSATPVADTPLPGGYATFYGSFDVSTNVWTLTGVGKAVNPSLPGQVIVRQVHGKASIGNATQSDSNNAVWNYVYADAPSGCTALANSVNIDVPLYVKGSLCLSNSSQFSGYQLEVGGTVSINNSAHIGSATAPIHDVHIGGGCSVSGGPYVSPCTSAQQVYGQTVDAAPANLTKPPVDLAGWYQNAEPGPRHPCTSGSTPFAFDNDTTMNGSVGTIDITPKGTAYDCKVTDASGKVVGELGWDGASKLTIAGTIFIDGSWALSNLNSVVYSGRATLYLAGTMSFDNNSSVCGVAACDATWDANTNLLAIVAGSVGNQATSVSMSNGAGFQGALYCVNDYVETNSVTVWGPIIARQLYFQNSTNNHYVPIGVPLPGMPATWDQVQTITPQPGSWSY